MSELDRSRLGAAAALALCCVPAGILTAPRVLAQAPERTTVSLEEIIVTATKRAVPLQDVPVAVSVLIAEDIVARGLTQYADYLNSLPGVYFADAGPARSVIRIRGLSAAEGGLPTLVATYFGETPTSVQGSFPNLRLVDIERVEVLRGPQGTLFGANALAGAVRILPAQPDLEHYEVDLGTRGFRTAHSDDDSYHVEGVLNLPLAKERFALRLVGYKDDIAGYIDNLFPGQPAIDYSAALRLPPGFLRIPAIAAFTRKDTNTEDTVGGRAAAAWQATERLRFDLGYTTQKVTLTGEPFVTPSVNDYAQSRGLDAFARGEGREDADIASLTVRYDWDAATFTSASAWSSFDQRTVTDVTETATVTFGVPVPAELRNAVNGNAFTQELRLQSLGPGALQWLFGVFFLDRDNKFNQIAVDYSCPTCLPRLLSGGTQDFFLRGQSDFGEKQRSLFGELTYDFSPHWTVGAGARWLDQDLDLRIRAEGPLATGPTDAAGGATEFNPSAHLRFRPSDDLTLYLQAARGFRSGVPNQTLPAPCQPEAQARGVKPITDADTLWNYEIGFKAAFVDHRLSLNGAAYHADWSGIQLGIALACNFAATINGGDATTQGVELELVAQPTNAWRFNLATSYNKVEFDRVKPGTGFIDGERVPGTPQKSLSAGVQYGFLLGGDWSCFARADYEYVGDVRLIFSGLGPGAPRQVVTQDAYGTGNVRLGFSRHSLALEAYARNVADKRAVVVTGNPNPVFGGDQFIIRPREVGLEVRYSYR